MKFEKYKGKRGWYISLFLDKSKTRSICMSWFDYRDKDYYRIGKWYICLGKLFIDYSYLLF